MRPDGTVIDSPGYDEATRLFYVKPANLSIPKIPENPSNFEIEGYLGYLLEAICDFPFVEDADRANALGLIMTLASAAGNTWHYPHGGNHKANPRDREKPPGGYDCHDRNREQRTHGRIPRN